MSAPDLRTGIQHHAAGRLADAEQIYRALLDREPDNADALHRLGLLAHEVGKHELAVAMIEEALLIQPSHPFYLNDLGEAYRALGRLEEAESMCRQALSVKPDYADAHNNLAIALHDAAKFDAAERAYQTALKLDPALDHARLNYSLLQLLRGDYKAGFANFESRFEAGNPKEIGGDRAFLATLGGQRWTGEPLRDKTLLIWTEQGLGDSLMMMRYLPLIKERGVGRLVVCCSAPLMRIVQEIDAVDEVFLRNEPLRGTFDFHCPIMSLPLIFDTRLESIPATVPYLHVPASMREHWTRELAKLPRPRIGVVWAGAGRAAVDARRSIGLELLAPLLRLQGASFVSLQKGIASGQHRKRRWKLFDAMDACADMLDTAALITQLDLVVSVDTSVAHLAGALGRPVWLLNRYDSEWRWMLEREDSPWYPTLKIFRQPDPANWSSVIERVASAVEQEYLPPPRETGMLSRLFRHRRFPRA